METNPRTKPDPMSREDIAPLWFILPPNCNGMRLSLKPIWGQSLFLCLYLYLLIENGTLASQVVYEDPVPVLRSALEYLHYLPTRSHTFHGSWCRPGWEHIYYLHISTHAGCRLVLDTLYLYRHYCLFENIFTLKWFNKQQHNVVQFSDRFSVEMSCSLLLETNSTSPYPWAGTFDVQNTGSNYNHNTLSPTENCKYAFVSSASGACN